MNYTIQYIAAVLGASLNLEEDQKIEQLLIDSRKVYFPATSLFFALAGPHKDGHEFIKALYEKGVRNFVVSKDEEFKEFVGANFIRVGDTLHALQQLAAHHRHQFDIPIIGITGSNGKTIVKELLYQMLYNDYRIVRSPKSYNSQIGVPLSVWQMNDLDTLDIFEAGISLPDEMQKLQHIIDPTIGIFTFIGDAHAEGFNSLEQKTDEKLLLFTNSKVLFYCRDERTLHERIALFAAENNPSLHKFSWGKNETATVVLKQINKRGESTNITLKYATEDFSFSIPFTDEAAIHNAITCCCVLLYLNIPAFSIAQKMLLLKPIEMRLELKQGNNNCSIINDGYSSDINSLNIALDFLQQQQQHTKRTVILSDVLQATQQGEQLYKIVAAILAEKKLYRFIGIGPQVKQYAYLFNRLPDTHFYSSTEEFLQDISSFNFNDETILLKGARVFEFEKISNALEQKTHQTLLEINLNALRHNLNVYRKQLHPGVKLMAMVKAFSYGSGSFEIANILQYAGADYLAVAYADEGIELRKAGIRLPVMVMNIDTATFNSMIKYDLEPEIYSFNILHSFRTYLRQHKITKYPVHIKLDTGMHRLGFEGKDITELNKELSASDDFYIKSVFSHLVASGEAIHDKFTNEQAESYSKMASQLEATLKYPFIKHIANTSAIGRLPHLQWDMVRLGIGLYGVDANPSMQQQLKTVATLKTTIAQIKNVKKGESVGYSRKGIVQRDSIIATVRIGYADGYRRSLGNGVGQMYVNGQMAKIVGNICMDMTMLDITDISAKEEDEVIVFGEELPVYSIAEAAETIPYEILTGISERVKRVYFEE